MFKPMKVSPSLEQIIQSAKTLESVYTPLKEARKALSEAPESAQPLSEALDALEESMGSYQQVLMEHIEDITGSSNLTICSFEEMQASLEEERAARAKESATNKEQLQKAQEEISLLRSDLDKAAEQSRKAAAEASALRNDLGNEASERSRGDQDAKRYAQHQGGRGVPWAVIALVLALGALAAALTGTTYTQIIEFFSGVFK